MKPLVILCSVWIIPAQVLSAGEPSPAEQFLIELINRGRADPAAEAARYGLSSLNEGVSAANQISAAPKPPLAWNSRLIDAARAHSQWMVDTDTFSHTGSGGSAPQGRMQAAGYTFTGAWSHGENIAWNGTTGTVVLAARTAQLHQALFVDTNYPGRGHRVNLMNTGFDEVGVGVVTGVYAIGSTGYNAVMGTQDFAKSASTPGPVVTGVVYADDDGDQFYTMGEGLGGISVSAVRAGGSQPVTTVTAAAGGYNLVLDAGTWALTFSGPGISSATVFPVTVAADNVKADLRAVRGSPFSGWMAAYPSLTGDLALPGADPDRDGLTNFAEFALGGHPGLPSGGSVPAVTSAAAGGAPVLRFSFLRSRPQAEVTYRVQAAPGLSGPWTDAFTNPGSSGGPVTVEFPLTGQRLFVRLHTAQP